jgi:alpha-galactosidase
MEEVNMSFKVAFIGAGSILFTRKLLADILSVEEFKNIEVAFTDINALNLEKVTRLCQRDIDSNGLSIRILATLDRKEAVKDAKYVFNTVRVGGLDAFQSDIEIPLKYGVDQCVGDTLSAGGIMYGQRGIATVLDFARDIKELAMPGCLLFNHANPNAMITWAANQYGGVHTIGLCHGVQEGHKQIANVLGFKPNEVDIICAGINHQTWYIQVRHKGKEMTGLLLEAFEKNQHCSKTEKVRIDMLRRFGYYSTESNGHLSEYVPWYRKRTDDIKNWIDLDAWSFGETAGYLRICIEERNWFETEFPGWMKQPPIQYSSRNRSNEHGSYIMEGLETGRIYCGNFNVVNNGTITNLPDDSIVEVPGYIDWNGISIPKVGDLPLGCAAVCNASISVQRLAVQAAVKGDDMLLRQAMMLDPLVGAVLNPPEIWQMTDEMLVAQEQWLPQYKDAIIIARQRLASGNRIPLKDYQGAARLKVRTIDEIRKSKHDKDASEGIK